MTPDELKKYKKQIEMLKKDFHKENPENIETDPLSNLTDDNALNKTPGKSNSVLDKLKQLDKTAIREEKVIPVIADKVVTPIKTIKNVGLESVKQQTEQVKQYAENKISNTKTSTEQASYSNNIEKQIIKPIQETKVETVKPTLETKAESVKPVNEAKAVNVKPIQETKVETIKTAVNETNTKTNNEIKDVPPVIPPVSEPKNDNEDEGKSSILKYILLLLLLLLLGFVAYYFYNKNNSKSEDLHQVTLEKKKYEDSVLAYEQEKIKQEIEDKYNEDNIELEASPLIADTIYQVISNNPEGIYAVIGSYAEMKNANSLKNKQQTGFESFVFEADRIRVALKISDEENLIFDDLTQVKAYYPDAWLMNNKN